MTDNQEGAFQSLAQISNQIWQSHQDFGHYALPASLWGQHP